MKVIQRMDYPNTVSKRELERWADGIPRFPDCDPTRPEWQPTPLLTLDLSQHGLGKVLVKDESVNPTGTFKDRMGWEVVPCLYRDWARQQLANHRYTYEIPRLSIISSGSALASLAYWAEKYALPPPSVLVEETKLSKLTAPFKPFLHFKPADMRGLIAFGFTGKMTGVTKVSESYLNIAKKVFDDNLVASEYSGVAGLAGALQDAGNGYKVNGPILVINTGKCKLNR